MPTTQVHGAPTWTSALLEQIRRRGLARGSIHQWAKFLEALDRQGICSDEISASELYGPLSDLCRQKEIRRQEVEKCVNFRAWLPLLEGQMDDRFLPSDAWMEMAEPIPPGQYARRRLPGHPRDSSFVIRYRHRSLGWSVALARHKVLFRSGPKWWLLLDPQGRPAGDQPAQGFDTAQAARVHAQGLMQAQFTRSAQPRQAPRWEQYSMAGLDGYSELLITLPHAPRNFESPHFPGVRNLMIHLRTNVCELDAGRRVLFLDEVQSDWHAQLARLPLDFDRWIPFGREWPMLALKFALWWAAKHGLHGVAWSTPEAQCARWRASNPPIAVYQHALPQAASKLARHLGLRLVDGRLSRRRIERGAVADLHWRVVDAKGNAVTRPFETRAQAVRFADLTGAHANLDVPMLLLPEEFELGCMPLFGARPSQAFVTY
jgi:hypothetical protein